VVGSLREANEIQRDRIDEQQERLKASARELNLLREQLNLASREASSLRGQLAAAVTGAKVSGAALATSVPEFVMVGISRGQGKRIQVSRDIEVTAFTMTEPGEGESRFKIGAVMAKLLVIDSPTYAGALSGLATIWANQDHERRLSGDLSPVSGPLQLPTGDA
jgi:hypothetical protein